MQIPQIRMESQMAKINIEQRAAVMEIEQPNSTLSIEQPKADMEIRTTRGKLTIDQSQAWEETNLGSTASMNKKYSAESRNVAAEGTARRAEQGAELLDIHKGTEQLANQAEVNGNRPTKTLGFKYIPSPFSVKISYEPGDLQINFNANRPQIDARINKPQVNVIHGGVHISMQQYASLNIYVDEQA